MGFRLRCVIAAVESVERGASVIAELTAAIPWTRARAIETPFRGIVVGAYTDDLRDAFDADPSQFAGIASDADELEWGISERLLAVSRRRSDQVFAYVDVDCFGGVCLVDGEIVQDGKVLWALARANQDGHLDLFERLGLGRLAWQFPPFERGFLD